MQAPKSTKVLDSAIAFTKSSFSYKHPYQPAGTPLYKIRNKISTFFNMRAIEAEFIDFKSYYLHDNFKDIYSDLSKAFRRGDKVILRRSCSEGMYDYCHKLLKEKDGRNANPFYREVHGLQLVQARVYSDSD